MPGFGERIKEERIRLGLNQEAFAAAASIQRRAQINYEQGKGRPDIAYLSALCSLGVDIEYILIGQRKERIKDKDRLRIAIEAVEEGLILARKKLSPEKKVELIMAAYDLIGDETASKFKVIELLRIAI